MNIGVEPGKEGKTVPGSHLISADWSVFEEFANKRVRETRLSVLSSSPQTLW